MPGLLAKTDQQPLVRCRRAGAGRAGRAGLLPQPAVHHSATLALAGLDVPLFAFTLFAKARQMFTEPLSSKRSLPAGLCLSVVYLFGVDGSLNVLGGGGAVWGKKTLLLSKCQTSLGNVHGNTFFHPSRTPQ